MPTLRTTKPHTNDKHDGVWIHVFNIHIQSLHRYSSTLSFKKRSTSDKFVWSENQFTLFQYANLPHILLHIHANIKALCLNTRRFWPWQRNKSVNWPCDQISRLWPHNSCRWHSVMFQCIYIQHVKEEKYCLRRVHIITQRDPKVPKGTQRDPKGPYSYPKGPYKYSK